MRYLYVVLILVFTACGGAIGTSATDSGTTGTDTGTDAAGTDAADTGSGDGSADGSTDGAIVEGGSDSDAGTIASSGEPGTVTAVGTIVPRFSVARMKENVEAAAPAGIIARQGFQPIVLPEAEFVADGITEVEAAQQAADATYDVEGIPDWLEFDPQTRTIDLAQGLDAVPAGEARRDIEIVYVVTNNEEFTEATITLNDIDGDTVNDSDEVDMSAPPLVNRSIGYITGMLQNVYENAIDHVLDVSNGLVGIDQSVGLDPTIASDTTSDIDSDGITDVVEMSTGLNPFIPTAPASFTEVGNYPTVKSIWFGLSLADFNGDGNLDTIATAYGKDVLYYWSGNGDGTFDAVSEIAVGTTPQNLTVADFDSDGDQDVAVAVAGTDSVDVLINNGSASFVKTTIAAGDAGSSPRSVVNGDIDQDGAQDLLITHSNVCYFSVLFGDGAGAFAGRTDYTTCTVSSGNSQEAATLLDVNDDGSVDAVVISSGVNILLNDGNGAFGAAVNYDDGGFGLAGFDADDDGDLDIISSGSSDYLKILMNDGAGIFSHTTHQIVQRDYDTGAEVLDINGEPTMVDAEVAYQVASSPRGRMVVSDFNGDGMIDSASASYDGNAVSVLYGQAEANGDIMGRIQNLDLTSNSGIGFNYHPSAIDTGDLNGDNRLDLVVGSNENGNGITVFLNE